MGERTTQVGEGTMLVDGVAIGRGNGEMGFASGSGAEASEVSGTRGRGALLGDGAPRVPGGRGALVSSAPRGPAGGDAPSGNGASRVPGGDDALRGSGASDPSQGGGAPCGGGAPHAPGASSRSARRGRRKRTLSALALGLCAVGLAVGSGADFTARTANPSNVFSAGSLSMENSKDGTAILNATGMLPGGSPKTGTVDIKNTGSVGGRFSVSRDQLASTDANGDNPIQFAAKVVIGIVDCGKFTTPATPPGAEAVPPTCGDQDDQTLSLGPLSIQSSAIDLGKYEPGEKHRYRFEASLDSSAGNEFSGDSSSARYVFDAKQTP